MSRSRSLIKGFWWRCFGILFLILVLGSIFSQIITFPLSLMKTYLFNNSFIARLATDFLSFSLAFLVSPFYMIANTLLYYDLKIRKENFDLHMMVDNLAEKSGSLPGE